MNIYVFVALILLLGFIIGRLLRRIGLTEVLAYLTAGLIIGPVFGVKAPEHFESLITATTLALVGYMVGLSFSFDFLKKMGRKILIILTVEVLITSFVVWGFVYVVTKNLPLAIILGSLAPATAPAGTVAVFRDLRARGTLTNVAIAIVGLDDAAGIIIYSIGLVWVKMLLGGKASILSSLLHPAWEIFGAIALGGGIGAGLSYITRKVRLSSDHIFVISIAIAVLCWGLAEMIGVSTILACMVLGAMLINLNGHIANHSNKLIDSIMTPIFILFFAAIGMEINFSQFVSIWPVVLMYCVGRSVGKIIGCGMGGVLSKSEPKITRYLGIALLNQAGVAVGLAFLATQQLSGYGLGGIIITLMATTTALFQIISPLGTQYAIKRAGEASASNL